MSVGGGVVQQLGVALSRPADEHPRFLSPQLKSELQTTTNTDQLRGALPILLSVINGGDRVPPFTTHWCSNALPLVLSNPSLPAAMRTALSVQSLPSLSRLLSSPSPELEKAGLQAFASIYPSLFREAATGTVEEHTWAQIVDLKAGALQLWRNGGTGSKLASVKVLQRIVQTQTRGTADPRLQRTAEPNLSLVRPNHAFLRLNLLEDEAHKLLEEIITLLFTSSIPDLVSSLTTALVGLVKLRPGLAQLIITALVNWTPAALDKSNATTTRSAEKTIRIALTHLLKSAHGAAHATQINEFLARQAARMEQALTLARKARELEASRKRQLIVDELVDPSASTSSATPSAAKRRKLDPAAEVEAFRAFDEVARRSGGTSSSFDASSLSLPIVVDLVVSSLQTVSDEVLHARIADVRRGLGPSAALPNSGDRDQVMKDEGPQNPLNQDLGDEELGLKAEVPMPDQAEDDDEEEEPLHQAATFGVDLADESDLASVHDLPSHARTSMIQSALRRICTAGSDGAPPAVWVPLVARLVTRGLGKVSGEDEDEEAEARREGLRKIMFDFVVADLRGRMEFARVWLNEEWYSDGFQTTEGRPYERWLRQLLQHVIAFSTNNDKSFVQFMIDLPAIPKESVLRLGDMCTKPSQVQLGFTALRDLALLRPPSRQTAVDVLLGLTSSPDKMTRNAAINTVKRWVPDVTVLSERVTDFSKVLFSRLETLKLEPNGEAEEKKEDDEDMDMETTPPPPVLIVKVEDGAIVEGPPPPTTLPEILQHVELLFALSVKNPVLLEHVFESYGRLPLFAQEAIQALITPVIKSLGVNNEPLLKLIGQCPKGSDDLVLRVVNILADKGRLPAHIATIIREMAHGREEINARLYMLVIAECDKPDKIRYLPPILKLLNNTAEVKAGVRSIFLSILLAPSQQFGSSSNAPGTKQSELLTPVELMMLLHTKEREIGVKQTIEAISICFTMSDAFRSEMMASFMQVAADEPVVPTLFVRTVLQAVSTYKNLAALVTSTILPKLITREVWTTRPLWEGFIRVAQVTAPNSFSALLLLPPNQLLDVITKQPALKDPLRAFALKKIGSQRTKIEQQIEVLGGAEVEEPPKEEEWEERIASPVPEGEMD